MDADFSNAPQLREAEGLVDGVVALATNYRIATPEQYASGGEQLKALKGVQKRLEELRTGITAPLNRALKAANDMFRAPTERLATAERTIKSEIARYANEQERIRTEEQRKADEAARREREKLEAQAARAAASGKVEKADALEQRAATVVAPVIQREPPKVAGIGMREVPKFEIVDAALLPREYLLPDEKKIGGVVRALKLDTKIPGVRVWMERQVAAGAA